MMETLLKVKFSDFYLRIKRYAACLKSLILSEKKVKVVSLTPCADSPKLIAMINQNVEKKTLKWKVLVKYIINLLTK